MIDINMTKLLSEQIRACRDGVVKNPFQGRDKKVLFVCSMGILRSATAARIYAHKYNTRCAGSWGDALIPLTPTLLAWANEVVFVNKSNYDNAVMEFGDLSHCKVRVLDIPDTYEHMHPDLIKAFNEQYEPISLKELVAHE
jgi:predicted protein tyrosine phosphatase